MRPSTTFTHAPTRNVHCPGVVSASQLGSLSVHVIFGEKFGGGAAPPYPSWLLAQGFACSVAPGGGGTVMTFYHETLGANDQVSGPRCFKSFPAGQVALGPRVPTGANSKMYTVFVDTLLASCAPFAPSNEKNQ